MINNYINKHKERFLEELLELLRLPSISASPEHIADCQKCAEVVAQRLHEAGADLVEICPTKGNPIVYAEKNIDPKLPTILIYGHYDVQPPDPLDLWDSPPFEPIVKNEKIYARGSADDKGQFYMHIKALEAMLATNSCACNLKFMIEGEEEIGSNNLETFVISNKTRLAADVIVISDTAMIANNCPSIDTGLRGLSYMEVEVTGPNRDLHSGVYGGAVANPINVLAQMIASLHNAQGQVNIPGFYTDVAEVPANERAMLAQAPFNLDQYKKDLAINDVAGEAGYTTTERASIRPTLDCNGIWGGYTGQGAKTVLPSKASAKISMRLVPNQNSETITALFTDHFKKIAPASVQVKVTPHHGGQPAVTPITSTAYKAAEQAMEQSFGKKPIPTRGGGSIPIVALFEKELGLKTVLMGFGLDSDAIHSPNEHYGLFNYYKGIETIPLFVKYFAALST
jgi:acetylornithine deacetylase/succinyl-diaminopimelate desuccinylase-like protein